MGIVSRRPRVPGDRPYAVTSPAPTDVWEEVLDSAPRSLPSQAPQWLRCVCAVGGYEDASRLYQTDDGRRLVLPLVRRTLLGRTVSTAASLPAGWGPAGLLGQKGVVLPEDVRMIFTDLGRHHAMRVSLRPDPATAAAWDEAKPAWALRQPLMAQTLSLEGGFDEVWRTRFRADARNRVRRAERAGVVVERDDRGRLMPVFHDLYAKSVERWARREGQPLAYARWRAGRREPARKLQTVATTGAARCRMYVAFLDGRAVAAIAVLFGATAAAYWRGAMDEELAGRSYANYLLHCSAIRDAVAGGCTSYHMGDSAPGSQLALFKSRFGAMEEHYARYQLGWLPSTAIADPMRRWAYEALRRRRGRR
jgi:hypothetical protein